MAETKARAAWQRTATHCFSQEDAKRSPKLTSCPSSSSSKPQVDTGPSDVGNGPEHPSAGFMPINCDASKSNLPPDTKWWLQLQSNFEHQKDFTYEQLNALEVELESLRGEEGRWTSKLIQHPRATEEDSNLMETHKNAEFSEDPHGRVSSACVKCDPEGTMHELKAVNSYNTEWPLKDKDMGEFRYRDKELMDLDPIDRLISKSEKLFDMESPWMGSEKTEPWWRTADREELASLVAQKSLEHIENCDLPPPQTMLVRRGPLPCLGSFEQGGIFSSSLVNKKPPADLCNVTEYASGYPTCGSVSKKQWDSGEKGNSLYVSNKPFSSSDTNRQSTTNKDPLETQHNSESEPSKAQLLEAIRHSQTRAREAEKAAQQAYREKEHIIKLVFRQASHLFAYKQWLQLLQLETICLHLKNKDRPISTLFPMVLPWIPYKGRQWKKSKHKTRKGKRGSARYDISKYAVAFAVGLGLTSAGLLLGWNMGWLIPMF